jgi:hypothetical protein
MQQKKQKKKNTQVICLESESVRHCSNAPARFCAVSNKEQRVWSQVVMVKTAANKNVAAARRRQKA